MVEARRSHLPKEGLSDTMQHFYVSVIDAKRYDLLAGPFATHQEALDMVEPARKLTTQIKPEAHFYGFGTCRAPEGYDRPGKLNARLGVRS